MIYWSFAAFVGETAPPETLCKVAAALDGNIRPGKDGYPRCTRMGAVFHHPVDEEADPYEVEVEIAPGLKLSLHWSFDDCLDLFDVDAMIKDQIESFEHGVSLCLDRKEYFLELVRKATGRARIAVAEQIRKGHSISLIDVTMSYRDFLENPDDLELLLHMRGIGPELCSTVSQVVVYELEELENAVERFATANASNVDRLLEVLEHGASGKISKLAVNVINFHSEAAGNIRQAARDGETLLPDYTILKMWDGNLEVVNGQHDADFRWRKNGLSIPVDRLTADPTPSAVGKPITEIVDHPYLSADMIVTSVAQEEWADVPTVSFGLEIPYHLFCATSGRVWEENTPIEQPDSGPSDRVVAFKRRDK